MNALEAQRSQPAMEYGAIDLHMKKSQVRIVTADGSVVWKGRIDTRREAFAKVFGPRPRMRILVESSTESEWVAQTLEALGHEAVVVDPNYAPMYGTRNRRIKTDERDVTALSDANRLGIFRRAHRVSPPQRQVRRELTVRKHLVRARTGTISLLRALLRQEGLRLPSGSAERILTRLASVTPPPALEPLLAPLRRLIAELNARLAEAETQVDARANADPVAQRLMTAPGVGPVVALGFRAVLDDPNRFGGDARRASAFLGLVPSEDSSGERQHKGHITKTGPTELRALLVQASWVIWRGTSAAGAALRTWAHALAARRGRRIAIIALARRLARILFAMWRDGTDFTVRAPRAAVAV
jgi:transposase